MSNRDLLKEAIADAKAVKETAIANAKAALEEAFTPQIKSMLASQILNEEEDEDISEADKVIREKKAMKGEEDMKEGYDKEETNEAKEEIDEAKEEIDEAKEEIDEAKEELDEVEELDEEFDLDEILAELDLEEGDDELTEADEESVNEEEEVDLDEMDDDELKAMIEDVIEDMIANGELETEESEEKVVMADEEEEDEEGGEEMEMDDMGDDELEEGIRDIAKGLFKNKEKEYVQDFLKKNKGSHKELVVKLGQQLAQDGVPSGDRGEYRQELSKALTGKEYSTGGRKSFMGNFEESVELAEALKTIIKLKDELNEVNLLNSKLLYTNKIFRNKNLTESQKVKVLSAFDKATNVKEVKLVYSTLNEGLVAKSGKSQIKESLGMASKPAGVAPKRVINESVVQEDAMVSRFKKLAGII